MAICRPPKMANHQYISSTELLEQDVFSFFVVLMFELCMHFPENTSRELQLLKKHEMATHALQKCSAVLPILALILKSRKRSKKNKSFGLFTYLKGTPENRSLLLLIESVGSLH